MQSVKYLLCKGDNQVKIPRTPKMLAAWIYNSSPGEVETGRSSEFGGCLAYLNLNH